MLLEDGQGSGRLKYFAIAKRKISLEVFYHKNSHFDGKRIWFDVIFVWVSTDKPKAECSQISGSVPQALRSLGIYAINQ